MDGQTDRQTDRFAISILRVSTLTRDKNQNVSCLNIVTIIARSVSLLPAQTAMFTFFDLNVFVHQELTLMTVDGNSRSSVEKKKTV